MVVVDSHRHSRFVLYPLDVVVTESVGADVDLEVVVEERAHTVATLRVITHTEGFVDEHIGVFVRDVGQTNVHVLASVVDQMVGESVWWVVGRWGVVDVQHLGVVDGSQRRLGAPVGEPQPNRLVGEQIDKPRVDALDRQIRVFFIVDNEHYAIGVETELLVHLFSLCGVVDNATEQWCGHDTFVC